MNIKMTIEVSLEQAVLIAEILKKPASAQTAAQPVTPAAVTSVPVTPPPTAVPVVPVQPEVTARNTPSMAIPLAVPVQQVASPAMTALPTAVRKYTADELSIASRPIVEAGRQQELLALLRSFTFTDANGVTRNVQNIREMPEEFFPAFANGIRQLGGKI
ncbi:MAG: hypothetical protein NC395_10300 [Prevotella sp.]|nr:hypothetical protein [Prevotella sp.]